MIEAPKGAIERAATIEIETEGVVMRLPADAPAERTGERPGAAGAVIVPAQAIRVVIATKPVDFRKGHDWLAALAQNELGLDPNRKGQAKPLTLATPAARSAR